MADSIWIAVVITMAGAWGWHAVTGHHLHLRLLRMVRPGTAVPETRHDSWWHSLARWRRAAVDAALITCAAAFGLAWQLSPAVTSTVLCLAVVALAGMTIVWRFRLAKRNSYGGRL